MTIIITAIASRPAIDYVRRDQQRAAHGTTDAATISLKTGRWIVAITAPVGQHVRGGELYAVSGDAVNHLRSDGMIFMHYDRESDATYDYEGTICDLTPETERLTFDLTLHDPSGRAVARYEQTRAPRRVHTVESMRADYDRQKRLAKERLPVAA
jgi:hypothetical protein